MGPELESALVNARLLLQEEMASEDACAEYLSAMGHIDGALHDLRVRDERLTQEAERRRIEDEARASGAYDTESQPVTEGYVPDP